MHFCVECGGLLDWRCPQCGAETQRTFKFFGQCGAALGAPDPATQEAPMAKAQVYQHREAKIQRYTPRHLAEKILTSRSALEGERLQVTVLFTDVANFTTRGGHGGGSAAEKSLRRRAGDDPARREAPPPGSRL